MKNVLARAICLLATLWLVSFSEPANATCTGQFSPGQVCGNESASSAVPSPISGVDTNTLNSRTANYTVATSDCGKTIQLGTGSTGFFTLTFPAVTGFASTCSVVATNSDTGRGKAISGLTGVTMLWPGQTLGARIVNGAWKLTSDPGLWRPTSDVTFCIDATSGSDSSDGLTSYSSGACSTPSQAFATIQKCIDVVSGQAFWNDVQPTCQVANHTGITQAPILRNYQSNALYQGKQPTVKGDCTTPGNVVIKGNSTGAVFTAAAAAQAWTVKGFAISPTSAGDYAFFADWYANMNVGATKISSATAIGIFARYNSAIEIVAEASCKSWEIAANMAAFVEASQNSTVLGQGSTANITFTLTGTPAWSSAFAIAVDGGFVDLQALNPSGASTGSRYTAIRGDVYPTGTTLPGNAAGTYVYCIDGSTSGRACLGAPAVAGASGVLTLPAGLNDALLSATSTNTVTNKSISSSQITGTTTNDNAASGILGEYIESVVASASAVSLTTGTQANLTSISLTAGDWSVWCDFNFNPGATTNITSLIGSISTTSATLDQTAGRIGYWKQAAAVPAGGTITVHAGPRRMSLSGTTTVYGVAFSDFTVSTNAVWGICRGLRER